MRVCFTCVNVGTKYSYRQVDFLFESISRNTTFDHTFRVCDENLLPTVWNKLLYFSDMIEPFTEDLVVAFDIDVLVKGNIDGMIEWGVKQDYVSSVWNRWLSGIGVDAHEWRRHHWGSAPHNSSILMWRPEDDSTRIVFDHFGLDLYNKYREYGVDWYLFHERLDPNRIPEKFYYSPFWEGYADLDFPIAIFNEIPDKNDILRRCPWAKNYGFVF